MFLMAGKFMPDMVKLAGNGIFVTDLFIFSFVLYCHFAQFFVSDYMRKDILMLTDLYQKKV